MSSAKNTYTTGCAAAPVTNITVTALFGEWYSVVKSDREGELGSFTDAECEEFGKRTDAPLLRVAEASAASTEEMPFKALAHLIHRSALNRARGSSSLSRNDYGRDAPRRVEARFRS
jgi:hypothetical protein